MKTTYKIITAKDFIKANPAGHPDLAEAKKVLIELLTIAQPPADYEILLDVRESYGCLTFFDVFEMLKCWGFDFCFLRFVCLILMLIL